MRCLTVAVSALLMGSLAIFVRNIDANPVVLTFFRMTFGFLYLIPLAKFVRFEVFKNLKVISLAFISLLTITFYITSIQLIEVAIAALLLYMAPVYVMMFVILKGYEVPKFSIYSLILALIGLFLLLSPYGKLNFGLMFGILSGFCYALYFIITKDVRRFASSIEITFVTLSISSLILSPLSITDLNLLESNILWILGLGLIPTAIPFILMNYGIKFCRREVTPIIALIEPVSAGIFGYVFFGEMLTFKQLIGAILIISSVIVVVRSGVEG